jgi:hypothetical protein
MLATQQAMARARFNLGRWIANLAEQEHGTGREGGREGERAGGERERERESGRDANRNHEAVLCPPASAGCSFHVQLNVAATVTVTRSGLLHVLPHETHHYLQSLVLTSEPTNCWVYMNGLNRN